MSVLTRITTRAKQIYKKGKAGITWVAAIKRASTQIKSKASPKRKRARTVKRKTGRKVGGIVHNPKLLAAGLGKGPRKSHTSYIKLPNVSGIGKVTRRKPASRKTKSLASRYKAEIKSKLASALLAYDLADTVRATKKAQKQKVKYRKMLRSL